MFKLEISELYKKYRKDQWEADALLKSMSDEEIVPFFFYALKEYREKGNWERMDLASSILNELKNNDKKAEILRRLIKSDEDIIEFFYVVINKMPFSLKEELALEIMNSSSVEIRHTAFEYFLYEMDFKVVSEETFKKLKSSKKPKFKSKLPFKGGQKRVPKRVLREVIEQERLHRKFKF